MIFDEQLKMALLDLLLTMCRLPDLFKVMKLIVYGVKDEAPRIGC